VRHYGNHVWAAGRHWTARAAAQTSTRIHKNMTNIFFSLAAISVSLLDIARCRCMERLASQVTLEA
jgi:hypothetical protein